MILSLEMNIYSTTFQVAMPSKNDFMNQFYLFDIDKNVSFDAGFTLLLPLISDAFPA